ncbi:MAG: class I SAM-dependent methyltransferase [Clostridia bacterium]|nr:class I SAM-dependent methyltransferase [Clostridia bacterium]
MLEKMAAFFEARLEGYDEHMLTNIESAAAFYPFTASLLPTAAGAEVLDLGCGTGLELEFYCKLNPTARITGIDLSAGMLEALRAKFKEQDMTLIQGSYFDVPLEAGKYHAAVSVESLHHFTKEQKTGLYRRLHDALTPDGYFILTDYFAPTETEELFYASELARLKAEQGITDEEFYHYDTPLTVEHEIEALLDGGFAKVEILGQWGATVTLRAVRES